MCKRNSIIAAFFLLSGQSVSANLTPSSKGSFDWVPVYGDMDKSKICGKYRPGDWRVMTEKHAQEGFVFTMNNACKQVFIEISKDSLESIRIVEGIVALEGSDRKSIKMDYSEPISQDWYIQDNIIPKESRGEPTVESVHMSQDCLIRFGNNPSIRVQSGVIIIPDENRAYYVDGYYDKKIQSETNGRLTISYGIEGKRVCKVEPLIIIPSADHSEKTGLFGKMVPQKQNTQDIQSVSTPVVAAGAAFAVRMGITLMRPLWFKGREVFIQNGVVIYRGGSILIKEHMEAFGITPTEFGQLAQSYSYGEAPTAGEVQVGLAGSDILKNPATVIAKKLSSEKGSGNCKPEEKKAMEIAKEFFCRAPEKKIFNCSRHMTPFELLVAARINAMCARQRDEIMQKCYDGGDDAHKRESHSMWQATKKCLDAINAP